MTLNFPDSPVDGQVYDRYIWVESRGVWKALENSDYTLANLDDLNITSVTDGQGIVYDSATSTWQNSDISVNVYDVETASTGFFDIPSGTTAERPLSPTNGSIRFNTDIGEPEYYSEEVGQWFKFREEATGEFILEYLVVAGGGGGGSGYDASGGGGGGYRSSVIGEQSGGGASAETAFTVVLPGNASYDVTVGAGGSGGGDPAPNGSNSSFGIVTSIGGGGGAGTWAGGGTGGSGGGSGRGAAGSGTANQGYSGYAGGANAGGGGGGAGASGSAGGGAGVYSGITGTSTPRAGGGGRDGDGTPSASGGVGGGGAGGYPGVVNTGGGGGASAAGGSGIVIIKYPSTKNISIGAGLTYLASSSGDYDIVEFLAGTDTITFS